MSEESNGTGAGKRDWFSIFLMVACVALAALVFLLGLQNRQLKQALADSLRDIPADALTEGEMLEPPTLVDDPGEIRTVEFGGEFSRTLLLVFSSTCPACEKTLPIWSEVIPEYLDSPGLQVIGIQLDRPAPGEDPGAMMTEAFPFPVLGITTDGHEALKRIPFIPAAILVDRSGTVEKAWYGVPMEADLEALRAALQ